MSSAHHDSNLQFAPPGWSNLGELTLPERNAPAARKTRNDSPRGSEADADAAGGLWLAGDALMCACPDCRAPISIREWLMIADCWQCGASIELSEEQIRAAERLIERRDRRESAPEPVKQPRFRGAEPLEKAASAKPQAAVALPQRAPPAPRPATPAMRPLGVRKRIKKISRLGHARVWASDLFRDMPAWLTSFVVHLIALIILALLLLPVEVENPRIVLSTAIHYERTEWSHENEIHPHDHVEFDYPIPPDIDPSDDKQRKALLVANQDAKELSLDANAYDPSLPDVAAVREQLGKADERRYAFAARDPRVRADVMQSEGGTTLTEAAVARALRWMARHQNADGSWSLHNFDRAPHAGTPSGGHGSIVSDPAGTSLVLLPFLGAGQTHLTGRYQQTVSAGLRWLVERQKPNGDLRGNSRDNSAMYAHGQAAIVLCEAYGMTQDEYLREPAEKAIAFIIAAQHPAGGWRYDLRQVGDTSVFGWQLMAMQSARAASIETPETSWEIAGHFLDSVARDGGAQYAYMPDREATHVMSAEALLCRMYLGWTKDDPGLVRGVKHLVEKHPPKIDDPDFYYWYYATQAIHHYGGDEWERWNFQMRDVLVRSQEIAGPQTGSWAPRGPHANVGGRLYTTSLAACTLEVYYRHVPIFRRIDLERLD